MQNSYTLLIHDADQFNCVLLTGLLFLTPFSHRPLPCWKNSKVLGINILAGIVAPSTSTATLGRHDLTAREIIRTAIVFP